MFENKSLEMRKILLICSLFVGFSASSQVSISSLEELIALADNHQVNLRNASLQNEVAQSRLTESKAYLYPTINAYSNINDNLTIQKTLVPERLIDPDASEEAFTEMRFGRQYVYTAGIQAQWDVLDFQRKFATNVQKEQVKAQKSQENLVKFNTYNDLASLYYSIILLQEAEKINLKNVENTEIIEANAKNKYEQGLISEADKDRMEARHLKNVRDLEKTLQSKEILLRQLQQDLGMEEAITVSDSTNTIAQKELGESATWGVHPSVVYQEDQTKIAEKRIEELKAVFLPKLSFAYQYNYSWTGDDFLNFNNLNHLPQQYVSMRLSVPVFSGFASREKVKQSKIEWQIAQNTLEDLRKSEKIGPTLLRYSGRLECCKNA